MITDTKTLQRYKKKYNFFETPEVIANTMAELLDSLGRGARILEPSAGIGALLNSLKRVDITNSYVLDFCEIQKEFLPYLSGYNHVGEDFMEYTPGRVYEAILMNPPYKSKLAEAHTDHAWECLKPGGVLVTLVGGTGAKYIRDEYSGHIFDEIKYVNGFSETSVDTFLFHIHKPKYY